MNRNFNLPPGCSLRDVEGAQTVECDECDGKGTRDYGEGDQDCCKCDGTGQISPSELERP